MLIETKIVKAIDCPHNVFLYIKKQKLFMWVDDIDYPTQKTVEFIFEEGIDETGIVFLSKTFKNDEEVIIVDYGI